MRLINNEADPQLVGVIEDHYELQAVEKQVKNLNQDLIDSGFNQYPSHISSPCLGLKNLDDFNGSRFADLDDLFLCV